MNRKPAALAGGLFALPFAILNSIVANRIEPFFSVIRPGPHTGGFEYVLLFGALWLLPMGAFIAGRPMLVRGADGKPGLYLLNGIVVAVLLAAFVTITTALGVEIYRCDVLQIPNCD